ncbi:unnamed protein product, partial [Prunus brigantina]
RETLDHYPSVRLHSEAVVRGLEESFVRGVMGQKDASSSVPRVLSRRPHDERHVACSLMRRGALMRRLVFRGMSDSESPFEREPNAFDGESSDDQWDTSSEAVSLNAECGEDTDVEILSEGPSSVPTHIIGKGLMTKQPVPLAVVYRDDSRAGVDQHYKFQMGDTRVPGEHTCDQLGTSTSGRGEEATDPTPQPRVTIVHRGNHKVPIGVLKKNLFGVDYLEPNMMTERELAKIHVEYLIPNSVKDEDPGPYRIAQHTGGW